MTRSVRLLVIISFNYMIESNPNVFVSVKSAFNLLVISRATKRQNKEVNFVHKVNGYNINGN